nr:flagellar basal body-associated FliL family protein [Amaricoccus macauensis]
MVPVLIAVLGLGVGIGGGMALKPVPEAMADVCVAPVGDVAEDDAAACAAPDAFAPEVAEAGSGKAAEVSYVPIEKPFVVPIFAGNKTVAMVVMSVSIAAEGPKAATEFEAVEPRLRDSFLKVMFRHANSGGFDGSYTTGRKIEDLKSALLGAAREVVPGAPVDAVLITEIARQES